MPVTAKLSRRFYDRFGDEITNELVDWMNSVDATYQTNLRELNEMNFARFDAKLEQRMAALDGRIDKRIDFMRAEMAQRFAGTETRLIRWMVAMWSGTILALLGLGAAIVGLR
jgi:hypothetical protein